MAKGDKDIKKIFDNWDGESLIAVAVTNGDSLACGMYGYSNIAQQLAMIDALQRYIDDLKEGILGEGPLSELPDELKEPMLQTLIGKVSEPKQVKRTRKVRRSKK